MVQQTHERERPRMQGRTTWHRDRGPCSTMTFYLPVEVACGRWRGPLIQTGRNEDGQVRRWTRPLERVRGQPHLPYLLHKA